MLLNNKSKKSALKMQKFIFFKVLLFFLFFILLFSFSPVHADQSSRQKVFLQAHGPVAYSPVIEREDSFNALAVIAEGDAHELMVNFNPSDASAWEKIDIHDEGFGASALLFTAPAHSVQFRMPVAQAAPPSLTLDFFSVTGGIDRDSMTLSGPLMASAGISIIKRVEWGADESLRYWDPELTENTDVSDKENESVDACADFKKLYPDEVQVDRIVSYGPQGERLVWPLAYSKKIQKVVVHHTASEMRDITGDNRMDSLDYSAMVRAIYHYHGVTRGWGDIGYNYLIDPAGNIYEGRAGGEKVIGAHVRCYNNGTIGVAILGNYENSEVPDAAMRALTALISAKASLYSLDPLAISSFHGKENPTIVGHKDLASTSCPGKNLYALLSRVRDRVALSVSDLLKENQLSAEILEVNAEPQSELTLLSLYPNQRKKLTLRFKNTGKKEWDSNTWMHVALNNSAGTRVIPLLDDKLFVAADMVENRVPSGDIGTFEVEVEAGYSAGYFAYTVAPVVNGRYKVSRASLTIPMQVEPPRYGYEIVKQNLPSGTVFQGQKLIASTILKNTGNVRWVNNGMNPIRFGTENLRDRKSKLAVKSATRLAHLLESEVLPGENGTFVFSMEAPGNFTGAIHERFSPVIEHVGWLEDKKMGFSIQVKKPRHAAGILHKTSISEMLPGDMRRIEFVLENRGDLAWDPENMTITLLAQGIEVFKRTLAPNKEIKPKKSVDFSFWIQAPYQAGKHKVFLKPLFKKTPVKGGSIRFWIDVPAPQLRAQAAARTPMSVELRPGEEKEIEIQFKNTGNTVWRNRGNHAVYLAPSEPQDRKSPLYYKEGWKSRFRAALLKEEEVRPGETGTFRFKIKPDQKGIYREYFQLVIEQVGWLEGSLVRWDFKVAGDRVKKSAVSKADSRLNQSRAAVITAGKASKQTLPEKSYSETKTDSPEITDSDAFRVRLSYFDDESRITANKTFRILDGGGKELFEIGANAPVSIRRVNAAIHVQTGDTVKNADVIRFIPASGGIVEILTMERRPSWNKTLNDNLFRGILEVRAVNDQTAYINELPLEDYLRGLAEVSNDSAYEKQKAIAVLARSYARYYMNPDHRKFPGLPYDGNDDPDIFQKYLGYNIESRNPSFVRAAAETAGEVVTYLGKLVKTPYFSQSDGRTRSAEEVFGWTNTPYLQSVEDPYCAGLELKGHGVGLSGYGAEGMAKEGKGYEEIIKYYYQGVEIETD